jgi:hypothetical protein
MAEQVMRTAFINNEIIGYYGNVLKEQIKRSAA